VSTYHQCHPETGARVGVPANVIHFRLDFDEEGNVDSEDNKGEESSKEGNQGGNQKHGEMGGEGKQPSHKNNRGGNWMDHKSPSPRASDCLTSYISRIAVTLYISVRKSVRMAIKS
jgi:hypothetical protein